MSTLTTLEAPVSSSSTDENKAVAILPARWAFSGSSCKEIDDAEGVNSRDVDSVLNWSYHAVRMLSLLCLGADFEAKTYGIDRSILVSERCGCWHQSATKCIINGYWVLQRHSKYEPAI